MAHKLYDNPIYRAIAKKKLHEAIVNQKIRIYMMAPGEPCKDFLLGLAMNLSAVGYAGSLDPDVGRENPLVRMVEGGMSACMQMHDLNCWDPTQARALDVALDAAERLNNTIVKEKYLWQAYRNLGAL